jgi:hypothetical protein
LVQLTLLLRGLLQKAVAYLLCASPILPEAPQGIVQALSDNVLSDDDGISMVSGRRSLLHFSYPVIPIMRAIIQCCMRLQARRAYG